MIIFVAFEIIQKIEIVQKFKNSKIQKIVCYKMTIFVAFNKGNWKTLKTCTKYMQMNLL